MFRLVLALLCAMQIAPAHASGLSDVLHRADAIRLRYFNPTVSYRTVYGVGNVSGPSVDYDVRINCLKDCGSALISIPSALSSARAVNSSCFFGPPYARLDLLKSMSGSAVGTLLFDNTGTCISEAGHYFKLESSLILQLHKEPLARW